MPQTKGTDTKSGTAAKRDQVADDRQRRDVGDGCSPGREAHPDQHRHPVGEDPGNHQRELQYFGWHRGACVGPLPPASAPDRRDLSGVARLRGNPGRRPLRHRPARRPARSSTSSRANALESQLPWEAIGGGQRCPPFFLARAPSKNWLTNDFHGFRTAFYELDEAFGPRSGHLEGFPLAVLLPITPRPAPPSLLKSDGPRKRPSPCRDDLCPQRPEPQHARDARAGDLWPCDARRCRKALRGNRQRNSG